MALRKTLADVTQALEKHAGDTAIVLLEQRMMNQKKDRITGTVVSPLFQGKNIVQRWGLVSEWLDEESIDQAVVGILRLVSTSEYARKKKGKEVQ